jgi:hypothetical protein
MPASIKFPIDPTFTPSGRDVQISGDTRFINGITLDGIWLKSVSDTGAYQVTAELPNGSIEPLLWLMNYKRSGGEKSVLQTFQHLFVMRKPMEPPAGTLIRGAGQRQAFPDTGGGPPESRT